MSAATEKLGVVAAFLLATLAVGCPRAGEGPARPEDTSPEGPGWVQPFLDFEQPPPTGAVGMYAIVQDRVGPLYANMPAELRFLQRIFTDFDVRVAVERDVIARDAEVFEVSDEGERLLVVEPDPEHGETEIERVRVQSSLFRSAAGVGVGDRFEAISRAHGPLECRAKQAPGKKATICRSPDEGDAIRWIFPPSRPPLPAFWMSPAASAERLRGLTATEVWWRPADSEARH